MRGILFEAPHQIRLLDDLPIPEPGEGEVVVRCTQLGLCGSNTGPYTGEGRWSETRWPAPVGWMGHENVGVIVKSRLAGWDEGTKILAQAATYNGFVEFFNARQDTLARLPADASDLAPYVIAQPLGTVLRALSKAEPVVNQRCAVVGQGPIGLLFTYMLRRMGARQVIGVDRIPWRLEWSRRMGATDVVDASAQDAVAAVRALTGGSLVEFAVDAGTTPESLATAAQTLRHEGCLCPFGVPRYGTQAFPWGYAVGNELRFVIAHGQGCTQFYQLAVDMVAGDCRALSDLVTPRLPWERAAEAFEMYADPARHEGSLKVVLDL
jgi:L-iditol 2-dehydrogenase